MRTVKGPVAKPELCAQETQRLARQIEASRVEVVPVGEGQDVGPKT
jgi:hypothetical protein